MTDQKTPEQQIQAMFFQALQPADRLLRPSAIKISIEPHPAAATTAALADTQIMTIDLRGTSFERLACAMESGLFNFGGMWSSDHPEQGMIQFMGRPEQLSGVNVKSIQYALASSIQFSRQAPTMAAALEKACRGRAVA